MGERIKIGYSAGAFLKRNGHYLLMKRAPDRKFFPGLWSCVGGGIESHELTDYLKRPCLYERTSEKFWTDPYIAAQMLKAHLDPTTDAASRRPEFINQCADWVASMLPNGAKILDIGCGPGLYTKQFAKRGLEATGLDFSENSIAYAREHDPGSEYILQDYLSMDFDSKFDMITMIYYDYGALIPAERRELLQRVYKALKPGGLFMLDVYTPLKGMGKCDNTSWDVNPAGGFWSAKPHICLNADNYYGEIAEGCRVVVIEEDMVKQYNLWDCYFTEPSLMEETAVFGFSKRGMYNDATGRPYSPESETLCAVLSKSFCDIRNQLDNPAVLQLMAACSYQNSLESATRKLTEYRDFPERQLYGWIENGEIIGVCGVAVHPDYVEIRQIAVAETARNREIGSAMVSALQGRYNLPIHAETDDDAIGFYRKCGFKATAVQKHGMRRWVCVLV